MAGPTNDRDPSNDHQPGDALKQREHREYMRTYQRRMHALGPLGKIAEKITRVKHRVAKYVLIAEKMKRPEIASALQLICEAIDDAVRLISTKGKSDVGD